MRVHSLDPPRSMILGTPGDTTWIWQLDPSVVLAVVVPGAVTITAHADLAL